ncbi:MAG: amino acid adenylation domain-containing protein, partial [Firmicutes bacterium]|nr:amino acid adenylation domain-containing protein [Bacillota bacterium]
WREVLNVDRIGVRDNFFDVGGNSLGLILVNNKLNALLGRSIPLLQLFKHPTIESLVRSLDIPQGAIKAALPTVNDTARSLEPDGVAVIGLAGRFPGADNVDAFWKNLLAGVESITWFGDQELAESGVDPETLANPNYVKAKGFLEGVEYFDPDFFDYSYQEANMMDPQIRILHQCVWEVLENAGYDPSGYPGRIGLFAGSGSNLPWMSRFLGQGHDLLNAFEALTLNEKDFLTTRISYKMNLKGPSFNIQTACSTSLAAIHQAVRSLRNGESDMAIAGGVSISYPSKEGYLWHEGMIFSKDGHCRPFADDSTGTVPGNGCGVVLLKPLAAALRDGDHIYAVVKGSAINNDGIEKIGYTAPSITGQGYVIETALKEAGVSAETITYLEAHGTGTKLGDPIEIEALKQAWKTERKAFCAIGSVKANIGHLDAAAGVAGFIKAVLSLYHRTLPPLINYQKSNPGIDFTSSPFYINTEAVRITETNQTLRAGVSSFGIGGTNVHVIIEQAPAARETSPPEEVNLLLFSARSQTALANNCEAVINYLQKNPALNLSDAAWTLQVGRKHFEYRKALVVNGPTLKMDEPGIRDFIRNPGHRISDIRRTVVFLFPGDESWYQGMGYMLYLAAGQAKGAAIFSQYLDQVFSSLTEEERRRLSTVLSGKETFSPIPPAEYRQLALFATEYSLAKTLLEIGIHPVGLLGQGIGEISAMAVSGALELKDAILMVTTCGELIQNQEPGTIVTLLAGIRATEIEPAVIEKAAPFKLKEPGIPLVANLCGSTVHFSRKMVNLTKSLEEILAEMNLLFIEAGAGGSLAEFVKQRLANEAGPDFVELVRPAQAKENDLVWLNRALGRIWCAGIEVDWFALRGNSIRKRLPLPTYVFDRKYHEHDVVLNAFEPGSDHSREQKVTGDCLGESFPEAVNRRLSGIWHEILGCDQVHPQDDFFALGGHSLKAIALAARIQKIFGVEIPLTEIFSHSSFGQMADWLVFCARNQRSRQIRRVEKRSYYEVSSAQKRMYAVNEMTGAAVPYNLAAIYQVEGKIDREKFKKVIDQLAGRHESFRTRFTIMDGQVVQIIEDTVPSVVEFKTVSEQEIEAEIENLIQPFDLSQAPLFRVKLISLSEEKHLLFIDMHHIISDQSSIAILLREFSALYSGQRLAPLPVQYKDFAAWQNELFKSQEIEQQFDYWKNEFRGEIPVLNLLTDFMRPRVQSFAGDSIEFEFGAELSANIDKMAKECGATPYMILMAALKLVLWKSTGQNDLVVGTGIAGRRHADLESIVGMFVNTLAIRSQIDETLTVKEYLQYIKGKMVKAYENQDCQFEMLLELLGVEKDLGRNPLFDVVINYINMGTEELAIEGLSLKPWPKRRIDSKFDLTWTIQEKENRYFADIEYATALFKRETVNSIGQRLLYMVSLITEKPNLPLIQLSIVTPEEKEWLLHGLNQTTTDFPDHKTIVQLFEEQVQQHGQKTAIIWENEAISYIELNHQANRLADLLAQYNVKLGNKVALLLERSPLQIVSILGILKCGGVYVPIDPDYPDSRVKFMLEDSGSSLVLTHSQFISRIGAAIPYIILDGEPEWWQVSAEESIVSKHQPQGASADDTVYIMYTSGSTGTPKGTLISHRNVIRVVRNTNYLTIEPTDRLLQLSNYAFDGSVFDIFGALLNGACLVMIAKEAAIEIPHLTEFIAEKGITVFFITTALFNMLVDWDITSLKNVRKILFGGEATSVPHARKALEFLGPNRLVNVYGPTETTVFASFYPINEIADDAQVIPIGYPISNTTLYVLDKQGQLVPPNVPGELYIGGAGVGKGYLNREELTARKFIPNPFPVETLHARSLGDPRLYRTGDLVWRLPGGEIGFIGRLDFQIKIRGFRVELGEIENHLNNIPGVKEAIVVARKDKTGSLYIAAYYTVDNKNGGIEPNQIREFLSDRVPDYMIPARMKKMDSLPLNLNGKIDRNALPVIEEISEGLSGFEAPRTDAERILLEAMQTVLDNHSIGIKDNFFKSGGQSIKAIALVQSLAKMGIKLKVNEIFQYPTVEELATLPEFNHWNQKVTTHQGSAPASETETLGSIMINERQMDSLVEHVRSTCALVSNIVVSSGRIGRFPLSPIQIAHALLGSDVSGFTTRINGLLDEPSVRKLLSKIIQQNQLLHCVLQGDETPEWHEYDISTLTALIAKNIPYLDLREYQPAAKELMIEKLCSALLLAAYRKGNLPWRLCCLCLDQDTHFVIWGFDHTAFDGMSAEALRHQIETEAALFLDGKEAANAVKNQGPPRKYQDYVSLLALGPQGVTEAEIMERFSLHRWREKNLIFMDNLAKIPDRGATQIGIRLPLTNARTRDPWRLAHDFVVKLLGEYTGVPEIPLAIVDYGRSYHYQDFYNCVGEFLDIIPALSGESDPESKIPELLKQCRLQSINFLALLYDPGLARKFS